MKIRSIFAKKMKDRGSWRVFGCSKKDLDKLIKPIQNHNVVYHQTKDDGGVIIIIIEEK